MTENDEHRATSPFHHAAEAVKKRLFLCRFLGAIRRTALIFSVLGLLIFVAARWAGAPWAEWGSAVALIALWATICAVWAYSRKPGDFAVLALWDEKAGRKEEFASALFFESKARMEPSEELHWSTNRARLDEALGALPADVPLPNLGARWVLPLLIVAFAFSPLLRPSVEAGDVLLSEDMIDAAEKEAERIAMKENEFAKMDSLTEEEKEQIEKLRQEINAAAEELRRSGDKTARDVLRELEKRARAAEKLAERMGSRGDEWASEEMLREMTQHADTADLAGALKDKKAGRSADESEKIEDRLKASDLSKEVRDRIDSSLSRVMEKATPEDHKRPVGLNVGAAAEDMTKKEPARAAKDFKRLADHFRRVAEREKAQEKLRKLAEELRKSGSNIAGKNLQSMKKLAGNKSNSMKSQQGMQMPQNQNLVPMNQQNMPSLGQGKPMPMPGMKPGKPGQGKPMMMAPVPGGKKGKPVAMIPGAGQKPGGGAVMMAPIPGTPGSQGSMMGSGLQAGQGTAAMDKSSTTALKADRSGLVGAQVNEDGESQVRAVEGGERTEEAERERQEQIVDFIKVEEDALDDQTLPLSRREHVLRYFTALRERFEEQE